LNVIRVGLANSMVTLIIYNFLISKNVYVSVKLVLFKVILTKINKISVCILMLILFIFNIYIYLS